MANAQGRVFLNPEQNKQCRLTLVGDKDAFKNKTDVSKAVDNRGGEWEQVGNTKTKGNDNQVLVVKLRCKTVPTNVKNLVPDAGTLTITLSTAVNVDPVPVTYVNDTEP